MSLPLVIIFERHWDTIPKGIVKELLPELSEWGYSAFCMETPHDKTGRETIEALSSTIKYSAECQHKAEMATRLKNLSEMSFGTLGKLLRSNGMEQDGWNAAKAIKNLPAIRLQSSIYSLAEKLHMSIKGVDIPYNEYMSIINTPLGGTCKKLEQYEQKRIQSFVNNLCELKDKGVVFLCGPLHAAALIAELAKRQIGDVLYYFPHSAKRFEEGVDCVKQVMNETLKDHTHLVSEADIPEFKKRIISEVLPKTYCKEHPEGNSQSRYLAKVFKVEFRIVTRLGHFADAILAEETTPDLEIIKQKLKQQNIPTRTISLTGEKYLAIPNINTKTIADLIFKLRY